MHNTKMFSFKSLYFNALKKLFIFSYKERETIIYIKDISFKAINVATKTSMHRNGKVVSFNRRK